MPKTRPPYDPEFRSQILEMVEKEGREPADLAPEFGVTANTIWKWVRQAELDTGKRADGLKTDEKEELARLRRENARLKEERDILEKAAAWFAQEAASGPRSVPIRKGEPGQPQHRDDVPSPRRDRERLPLVAGTPGLTACDRRP
jgi:transposase